MITVTRDPSSTIGNTIDNECEGQTIAVVSALPGYTFEARRYALNRCSSRVKKTFVRFEVSARELFVLIRRKG